MLRCLLFTFMLLLFGATPNAVGAFDGGAHSFSQLPVLHEGRIKPMESFASASLKRLSGNDRAAVSWLIETLFNPAMAETYLVVKVVNRNVMNMLALENRKDRLYSYQELSVALDKKQDVILSIIQTPSSDWTVAQRDLVLLQKDVVYLSDLLNSMTLFLPVAITLPGSVPKAFQPYAGKAINYLDSLKFRETLQTHVKKLVREQGDDVMAYSDADQALAYLSFAIDNMRQGGARSKHFRVIPAPAGDLWLAPWDMLLRGEGRPETSVLFRYWGDLARAYHDQDKQVWQAAVDHIYQETINLAGGNIHRTAFQIEHYYNVLKPLHVSTALYAFVLVLLIVGAYIAKGRMHGMAYWGLLGGVFAHFVAIIARVYILERPPVSTLYESIIFVSWIAAFYGAWAYRCHKQPVRLAIGAGAGLFLNILAFSQNQDGDSFLMLSAVLNTNFWLATHVICITVGYAFCVITSLLAHYALFQAVREKHEKPDNALFRSIHTNALGALLLVGVGTVLGGIWADQSWGRFWGWDPKENGALLIALWLIWVLHGRISGQMRDITVAAGLAYVSVMVALSWFGSNLLGVGLHSYGFTDSAAWGLGLFIAMETLYIGGALALIYRRHRIGPHVV